MNIVMEYGSTDKEISQINWDFSFCGRNIDERSCFALEFAKVHSQKCVEVCYDANTFILNFDNSESCIADDVEDFLREKGLTKETSVLLECTTLGVSEMLLLMQALKDIGVVRFDALYLEPKHYTHKPNFRERHHFELSQSFDGFIGIPGHAMAFERGDRVIVLCGFESERVGSAFEELDMMGKDCKLVFGMPPFIIGWDKSTYTNHIPVIDTNGISKEFYYVGASNPLAVYDKLSRAYISLEDNQKLFILPFGTKPMALGACLFKVQNRADNLAILYDHPVRKMGRTTEVSKWNLYRIIL